jgi:hypothetical protein
MQIPAAILQLARAQVASTKYFKQNGIDNRIKEDIFDKLYKAFRGAPKPL